MFYFGEFCIAEKEQRQLKLSERIVLVEEQGLHLFLLRDIPTHESLRHRT